LLDQGLLEGEVPGGIEIAEIVEESADFHPYRDFLIFGDVADLGVGLAADFAGIGASTWPVPWLAEIGFMRILMAVVFPAPFCPTTAYTVPSWTSRLTWSRAATRRYFLVSASVWITAVIVGVLPGRGPVSLPSSR
jgi:hypothetical protein